MGSSRSPERGTDAKRWSGRCFCQDLPLQLHLLQLTPQPTQFFALSRCQAVTSTTLVPVSLLRPVPDRVRRRLELLRQTLWATSSPDQLHHPRLELWRVRSSCPWHPDTSSLPHCGSVHQTGQTSLSVPSASRCHRRFGGGRHRSGGLSPPRPRAPARGPCPSGLPSRTRTKNLAETGFSRVDSKTISRR